jgi:hypothetical protein
MGLMSVSICCQQCTVLYTYVESLQDIVSAGCKRAKECGNGGGRARGAAEFENERSRRFHTSTDPPRGGPQILAFQDPLGPSELQIRPHGTFGISALALSRRFQLSGVWKRPTGSHPLPVCCRSVVRHIPPRDSLRTRSSASSASDCRGCNRAPR